MLRSDTRGRTSAKSHSPSKGELHLGVTEWRGGLSSELSLIFRLTDLCSYAAAFAAAPKSEVHRVSIQWDWKKMGGYLGAHLGAYLSAPIEFEPEMLL